MGNHHEVLAIVALAIAFRACEQPLARMMRDRGLSNHDVVAASARPISHKLVMRAARGRRLTVHSKALVVEAFNRATGGAFRAADLFDY